MRGLGFVCVGLMLGLSGCAKIAPRTASPQPPVAACDIVSGTATSYGRATTTRHAEQNLREQVPDSRGDLLAGGVRGLRTSRATRTCQPYPLLGPASGLVTCTVSVRICGRQR